MKNYPLSSYTRLQTLTKRLKVGQQANDLKLDNLELSIIYMKKCACVIK